MTHQLAEAAVDERLDSLANAIEEQVAEGTELLQNSTIRIRVLVWIREQRLHNDPGQIAPEILMCELTKALIKVWPDRLNLRVFEPIEQELPPVRRVRELLAPEGLKRWVLLSNEPVIIDTRMPVEEFKTLLWNRIFD